MNASNVAVSGGAVDPRATIVVAEDDAATRMLLSQILRNENYRVVDVENGRLACDAVRRERPAMVLLDWSMPVMDGLEALKVLKADSSTRGIPIVMLTMHSQMEEKLAALDAGVQDFIVKPCHPRELVARIDQQRRWRDVLESDSANKDAGVAAEIEWLRENANRDALTGLPNRSLLNDRLDQMILSSKRRRERFAALFLDLDGFKEINDTHGHLSGDRVLQAVAERFKRSMRASDTIARIGGDEFVVLAPRILTPQNAVEIAERLVDSLSEPIEIADLSIGVSTSVGISLYPIDAIDRVGLIAAADAAMYRSKREGKSRFTFASDAIFGDVRLWENAFQRAKQR